MDAALAAVGGKICDVAAAYARHTTWFVVTDQDAATHSIMEGGALLRQAPQEALNPKP